MNVAEKQWWEELCAAVCGEELPLMQPSFIHQQWLWLLLSVSS